MCGLGCVAFVGEHGFRHGIAQARPRRRVRHAGRNKAATLKSRLEMGRRIAEFLTDHDDVRPYGCWRRIAAECLALEYSSALATRMRRALVEWTKCTKDGERTDFAAGVDRISRMRRCTVAAAAARRKAPCLGYELLQWLTDEIDSLRSRADSALLLARAQYLRGRLKDQGVPEEELPKVCKQWLLRWRVRFGISLRLTTVRFKISFADCHTRLTTMFANVFRLRALWEKCFGGGVPMRWASYDQKPSWFNNAGLCLGR
jgi:hypothetical protein